MRLSRFTLLACAILIAGGLCFAEGQDNNSEPALVTCDIWPPYQVKKADGVTGFSVEVVKAVYKRMGVPDVKILDFPWKRALEMVKIGTAQALFSANDTPDRRVFTYYPDEPLVESPWVIWTRGRSDIQTIEDLKGKTIGVVLGYSYTQKFWDFIEANCNVEKVHSDRINFIKLSKGRIDATVAECGNGRYLVEKTQAHNVKPHKDLVIKKEGLYIIFNRTGVSEDFVQKFSGKLREFKQTKGFAALKEKWFGPENPIN